MAGVLFNNIPGNIRVPFFYAEFNPAGTPYQDNARLLLIGQMLKGTTTSAAKAGGNTGSGALTLDGTTPRLPGAKAGTYTVRCTTAQVGAGVFTVTDPYGTVLGTHTVGGAAFANKIKFTIADGTPDFIVGDGFDIVVTAYGTAAPNVPVLATDSAIGVQAGLGSMLEQMYWRARANAPLQEIWIGPLYDDDAGVAATGTITVAGAPVLQAAAMSWFIAGERLRVAVLTSDTNNSIAAAIAAAVNAMPSLPVSASASSAVVTLTAKHKGAQGNTIEVDLGNVTDEGVIGQQLLTIAAMSGGSGDPDMTTLFSNLGDLEFDWLAGPYGDANALGDVSDVLNDVSGRWSWAKQLYGHYIGTNNGTVSALSTLGNTRNDQHATIFPIRKFRSPSWLVAAAVGGQAAAHLQGPGASAELSRPLRTLELVGIKGPLSISDYLQLNEKQTLLYDGVSTYFVTRDGKVRIERLITTYQFNASGDVDATYLDVNTMAQSMYGIRYIRQRLTNHHGRKALADTNPGRNPGIVTVTDIKNTIVHAYEDLVALGVFEGAELFARDIVVERDLVDANRVNTSLPLDHVNQLQIIAANAVNHMQRREPRDALAA